MRRSRTSAFFFIGAFMAMLLCSCAAQRAVVEGAVTLEGGGTASVLTLDNGIISASVLPDLGGKIVSLKNAAGREFLSRSERPYALRTKGMSYGKTEFDGIDECFPSLGACTYPVGPWKGTEVPDHGFLCNEKWERIDGEGIILQVTGETLPFVFRRQMLLDENSLVLRYRVDNRGEAPFHYLYTFHPLFAGATGATLSWPDELPMTVSCSRKNFLGLPKTVVSWGEMKAEDGTLFRQQQYVVDSKRYYKYFTGPLKEGKAVLRYPDGPRLSMTWPRERFPYVGVWCSEGAVGGLLHIAPEPVVSHIETLDEAIKAKQAAIIPVGESHTWEIRIRVD